MLTIMETHRDVPAPGNRYAILRDGAEVGQILYTGLYRATWNLYAPGVSTADGVEHAVWRAIEGESYATYEEAAAAAQRLFGTPQTLDGCTITTVEQDGEYTGLEMGRVWLRNPQSGAPGWTWFGFGSVEKAAAAAQRATGMTAAQFDDYWERGE